MSDKRMNDRRLRAIYITPELLAELFKKGKHSYEVIENAIPDDGIVANAGYDLKYDNFVLIIHSDEFEEVEKGCALLTFCPVIKKEIPGK
jgi:hypothetical protein